MINGDFGDSVKQDNIDAMNKLLDEKESQDTRNQDRYRYYTDYYGNQYRWNTFKQEDGKFHAMIYKYIKPKRTAFERRFGCGGYHKMAKMRFFARRNSAKNYCLKQVQKAKAHQKVVISNREQKKQERLDAKPKLTKDEVSENKSIQMIEHLKRLQARCDTKIKTMTTRKKTYEKKIKYHMKRLQTIQTV